MVRTALIVLALAAVVTAPALMVVTAGNYPAALVWALWALWGVAVIGGGIVYLIAHRTGRL